MDGGAYKSTLAGPDAARSRPATRAFLPREETYAQTRTLTRMRLAVCWTESPRNKPTTKHDNNPQNIS